MTKAILRLAHRDDAPQLAGIYAPSVHSSVTSFELTPPSAQEFAGRLASVQAYAPWLVCELDGAVRGYAYVSRHGERAAYQWSLDSAIYLAADYHGRGVGRALYTALFGLARLCGYYVVYAGITLPNAASVGLHEALGFRPLVVYQAVGYKHGAWRDVGWWQLELRARSGTPAPPITPEQARAQYASEWAALLDAGRQLVR